MQTLLSTERGVWRSLDREAQASLEVVPIDDSGSTGKRGCQCISPASAPDAQQGAAAAVSPNIFRRARSPSSGWQQSGTHPRQPAPGEHRLYGQRLSPQALTPPWGWAGSHLALWELLHGRQALHPTLFKPAGGLRSLVLKMLYTDLLEENSAAVA